MRSVRVSHYRRTMCVSLSCSLLVVTGKTDTANGSEWDGRRLAAGVRQVGLGRDRLARALDGRDYLSGRTVLHLLHRPCHPPPPDPRHHHPPSTQLTRTPQPHSINTLSLWFSRAGPLGVVFVEKVDRGEGGGGRGERTGGGSRPSAGERLSDWTWHVEQYLQLAADGVGGGP